MDYTVFVFLNDGLYMAKDCIASLWHVNILTIINHIHAMQFPFCQTSKLRSHQDEGDFAEGRLDLP